MLLAVDIGNTNIVLGCFDGSELCCQIRLRTDSQRTLDEYRALVVPLIERKLGTKPDFKQAIVASVVPPVTAGLLRLIQEEYGQEALVVGPGTKSGLIISISDPASLGADRVVNGVAASRIYTTPVLVVDFGTATTFDFVDQGNRYQGGVIAPGLETSLNALVKNTAKLPRIPLEWPTAVIGKNTVSAMQAGAVIGYVSLVDGLIRRIMAEVGTINTIVATGGLGHLIQKHSDLIQLNNPDLTLQGLRILAELNREAIGPK